MLGIADLTLQKRRGVKVFDIARRRFMDEVLRARQATTLVFTGFVANNVVMYGARDLARSGYAIVVPEDGTGARSELDLFLAKYQMLSLGNPTNEPLRANAVTLSRADLISFE